MEVSRSGCGRLLMALAIAVMLAALGGCSKKTEQSTSAATSSPGQDAAISGTITLSPELKDKVGQTPLLMIMASTSRDATRPALVVKREADAKFPYEYKLTAEDITLVGSSFSGNMYVSARIDPAGTIGPPRPGSFGGAYAHNPVPIGASKVDIVIDKAY